MADESWSDDGWDGNAAAFLAPDESWGDEGWPDGSWSEDGFPAPAPTSNESSLLQRTRTKILVELKV